MPKVSEAIDQFLKQVPINHAIDLTSRYSVDMEVQVMVDSDGGEPIYNGDRLVRNTWSISGPDQGTYNIHHIRIPKKAMSEPYWNDPDIRFPIQRHVECIGMTGWNWRQQKSCWVAFDFDAITGHAQGVGVSNDDLEGVKKAAAAIPWVQVRTSTGGAGIHLYVYFDPNELPETKNHNVHAALSRCVLGLMEREAGFDFRGNMDVLGGNMWIWHRKISDDNMGLTVLKDYEWFCPKLPDNWKDNIDVVTGAKSKIVMRGVNETDYDSFEAQASARRKVEIDPIHELTEERIHELGYSIVWVPDFHCWQTHAKAFQDLMEKFPGEYSGIFKTFSEGTDMGKPNCFAFPVSNGGLRVTRFGRGAKEHETWDQDGRDWTWTYFNRAPSLKEAAVIFGGSEKPNGKGWVFTDFEDVRNVTRTLGEDLPIDASWLEVFGEESRNITLSSNKNNQLVIEVAKVKGDKPLKGWIEEGHKFIKLIRGASTEAELLPEEELNLDDRCRAMVDMNDEFAQWFIRNADGEWVGNNKDNVRSALRIWLDDPKEGETLLGRLVLNNWRLVNVPFQPEYLGQRRWNRNAPQLAVQPAEADTPHSHWDKILHHCAQDLNETIKEDTWCKDHSILNGADYLMYWLSFIFRDPYCKLPYLFMFGPQNSGKSIFHEAASLLMTRGVQLSDEALKNKSNFNGELAGAVLCVAEETNLSINSSEAYNRMKSWVTASDILIHPKRLQPYQIKNTTHWVQCANDRSYCPIFPGDTRITMMHVPLLLAEIPKDILIRKLREEASGFLRTLLDLRLPPPPGRLRLPVITTQSKVEAEESSRSPVQEFMDEHCYEIPGAHIKLQEFYDKMKEGLNQADKYVWTYHKVIDEFRSRGMVLFGRAFNNVTIIGNISLEPRQTDTEYGPAWVQVGSKLHREIEE